MFLHITFTDGSNPWVRFADCSKDISKDLRSWKRHYIIVDKYKTENGGIMVTVRPKTYEEEGTMRKANKEYYGRMKRRIREQAIEWQADFPNHNYSWGEIAYFEDYFRKQGKRYGLLTEFRENGIC